MTSTEAPVQRLKDANPDATLSECKRFYDDARLRNNSKTEKALIQDVENELMVYLSWRKRHSLDDYEEEKMMTGEDVDPMNHDAILWRSCCCQCKSSSSKLTKVHRKNRAIATSNAAVVNIPQFVFLHKLHDQTTITDKQGNKILHVLPALINMENGTAEQYGQTLLKYLDRLLGRQSYDKMTVLLDVRPGEGWPNPLAVFMVNFTRKIVKMLQRRFPGRLERLIVFPVPKPALGVYHAIQWAFHAELVEKIMLVSGSAERKSPLPRKDLQEYISEEILDRTESIRIAKFVVDS